MWTVRAAFHYGRVSILLLAVSVVVTMASAPSAPAQIRTTTYDGIPLDEPFLTRMRGVLLRIPAGYLGPWPSPAGRDRVGETKSIKFNFWMPDRRYVEIGDLSIAGFRPKEPGRGDPPPEASVVRVNDLQLLRPDELGTRSPDTRFRNLTSLAGISSYSFKEEFGLMRFWQHDWPHPQPEPFLHYRHMEGSDLQVLLRCTPSDRTVGRPGATTNPICDGYVYVAADELSFYIWFSGTHLPRWRENVLAARDLFRSWSQAP